MSRIESGRITINNEEFPFAKEIEQVNSMIGSQCREKGLNYEFRTTGKTNDYYVGDGMRLRQVLINLLGNAVKFTPEGGTVRFVIEEGPHSDGRAELRFIVSGTVTGRDKCRSCRKRQDAVEKFRDHDEWYYDAILMDMRMPEIDGLEATKAIRAMDRADASKMPIIALTANAFEDDVQRSLQAGLNAHLSKPVEPEVLFRTLEDLIEKRQDPET